MEDVPVLIVGGGPVGLTASILLSQAGCALAAGRASPRHGHSSEGARHQRAQHGDVPPMRRRGGHPQGRPAARTRRLHRLGAHAWPARRSSAGCRGVPAAERRREPRAQLPVRPGRPRAGAARLCRAAGGRRAPLQHRGHSLRAGRCSRSPPRSSTARAARQAGQGTVRHRRRRRAEQSADSWACAWWARRTSTTASTSCSTPISGRGRLHRPAALYFIEHPQLRGTFLTINGIDRWGFLVNSLAGLRLQGQP